MLPAKEVDQDHEQEEGRNNGNAMAKITRHQNGTGASWSARAICFWLFGYFMKQTCLCAPDELAELTEPRFYQHL
jgi:hypothetical protein